MRLSVCYIVKDEAKELQRSLASVKLAADELVIVMTADAPSVKDVALQAAAKLYTFSWHDDFSAARNFALEKLTGDWVIFLDADEFFAHPEEVRINCQEIVEENPAIDIIMLRRQDLYKMGETEVKSVVHIDPRIFRIHHELRYQGRIHEMLAWKDGHAPELYYADDRLLLYHTGYDPQVIPDKLNRNVALLERDIAEKGETLAANFYLADCYFGMGEYKKALSCSFKVLNSDFWPVGARTRPYHVALESMRQLQMPMESMLALAELGIRHFPDMPDFYGERGMILCGMGRLYEAEISLQKAWQLYESPVGNIHEESFFTAEAASRVAKRIKEIQKMHGEDYFLSACYIVRNEEKTLGKSLESIAGQVDEIIVVDTGSTDGTLDIAQKYGARCFSNPWQDDFAAARNFALGKARGEWVVFLDADEYFTPETAPHLRQIVQEEQQANLLMIYMRNIDTGTGESLLDFYSPRVFRRLEGLAYVGRIHEQLRLNGGEVAPVKCVAAEQLKLLHTGYSQKLSKAKAERNLKLLLREVEESTTPELFYMYLAETYDGLDDEDHALYYAEKDIAAGKKAVSYASRSYRIMLRILMNRPAQHLKRWEIARLACRDFPGVPDFQAELAECFAYELDFSSAVQAAERALQLFCDYRGIEPCMLTAEAADSLRHRKEVWEAVLRRMQTIKISSCLIATDEERDLPQYLSNTAVFSDERLIVDGGSVDNTLRLAQKAGCQIIHKPWQNDFATARNTALQAAKGDWAVVMDADEKIQEPEKLRAFLAFLDITRPDIDAVMVTIVNIDEDDENRELYRFPYTRFLRLHRNLSYRGRIHEQLVKADGNISLYQDDFRLSILHTGYSTRRLQRKLMRNLEILQMEIKEQGEKPVHYRYLAETYFGLGDLQAALRYAMQAIQEEKAAIGTQSDMYYLAWQCMSALHIPREQQVNLVAVAAEKFPALPEFWGIQGILAYDEGKSEQAEMYLHKAADLFARSSAAAAASSSSFASMADEVYVRLAALASKSGQQEQAEVWWKQAWNLNRHNVHLLNLYCQWHSGGEAKQLARDIWMKYDSSREELPYLVRFAENYGWMELYICWLAEMGKEMPAIYEQAGTKTAEEFFNQDLLPAMVQVLQEIPAILVSLEQNPSLSARELLVRCVKLLPEEMQQGWLSYEGKGENYTLAVLDRFLPAFKCWGNERQMARLEKLYQRLGPEAQKKFRREVRTWP